MSTRPVTTIDREHGPAFTVVDNELLRDKRLALDEKGLLCWFLSLPLDWQVIPAHVRKEHSIGRDKYYRMMKSLQQAGYVRVIVERAEDGTIACVRYRVRAIPIRDGEPAIPAERVGADVQSAIEAADADEPATPEVQPRTEENHPLPENPEVEVSQSPGNPESGKPDSRQSNDDLEITPPTPQPLPAATPAPAFRQLCVKWPGDRIVSASAAEKRFLRLTDERKRLAIGGVERYLAQTRSKGWKICDLQTYLRDRRWESVAAAPTTAGAITRPGTPQAQRWIAYWQAIPDPPRFLLHQLTHGRVITTVTEWPPPLPDNAIRFPLEETG